jgi:HlyD family secretion protein
MDEFLGWITGLFAAIIPGHAATPPQFLGYVEADYVYAAAPSPGTIESIAVDEGTVVQAGDVLFVLAHAQQQSQLAAAEARVTAAEASVDNLKTGGRSAEVEVARANLDQAQAQLALANAALSRTKELFDKGLTPQAKLDQDQATADGAVARVAQLKAQLEVIELPARDAQLANAEAMLAAARADAETARAALNDRTIVAPVSGRVETLFFNAGETAAAGVPVVSIIPDDALKVRFYVGETERVNLAIGDAMTVGCDGCETPIAATVSRIASEPQFTPPVIYSRDERNRMVFLAEATLADATGLLPGQPVTVGQSP